MDSQMKNPIVNATELDDTALEEVAGGLNLGSAPVRDEISISKQVDKARTTSKERLDQDKTVKVDEKKIDKAEVAKTLKDAAESKDKYFVVY